MMTYQTKTVWTLPLCLPSLFFLEPHPDSSWHHTPYDSHLRHHPSILMLPPWHHTLITGSLHDTATRQGTMHHSYYHYLSLLVFITNQRPTPRVLAVCHHLFMPLPVLLQARYAYVKQCLFPFICSSGVLCLESPSHLCITPFPMTSWGENQSTSYWHTWTLFVFCAPIF